MVHQHSDDCCQWTAKDPASSLIEVLAKDRGELYLKNGFFFTSINTLAAMIPHWINALAAEAETLEAEQTRQFNQLSLGRIELGSHIDPEEFKRIWREKYAPKEGCRHAWDYDPWEYGGATCKLCGERDENLGGRR